MQVSRALLNRANYASEDDLLALVTLLGLYVQGYAAGLRKKKKKRRQADISDPSFQTERDNGEAGTEDEADDEQEGEDFDDEDFEELDEAIPSVGIAPGRQRERLNFDPDSEPSSSQSVSITHPNSSHDSASLDHDFF